MLCINNFTKCNAVVVGAILAARPLPATCQCKSNQLYVQLAVLPVVYRILETGAILKNLMF